MFLVAGAAGLLALAAALAQPDQYRSAALLLPQGGAGNSVLASLAARFAVQDGSGEDVYYTDILESRWMLEALARDPYAFSYRSWKFGRLKPYRGTLAGFLDPDGTRGLDWTLARVGGWVDSNKSTKTGTLTVEVRAPSPELAWQLTRKLVRNLEQVLKDKVGSQGQAKAAYTASKVVWAKGEEAAARDRFVAFSRDHVNYAESPDPRVRTLGETLYADLQLRREVLNSLTLAQVQAEVEAHSTLPLVNVLEDGYLPTRKSGPPRLPIAVAAALGALLGQWVLVRLLESLRRIGRGEAG
jgi:hypothetical protein